MAPASRGVPRVLAPLYHLSARMSRPRRDTGGYSKGDTGNGDLRSERVAWGTSLDAGCRSDWHVGTGANAQVLSVLRSPTCFTTWVGAAWRRAHKSPFAPAESAGLGFAQDPGAAPLGCPSDWPQNGHPLPAGTTHEALSISQTTGPQPSRAAGREDDGNRLLRYPTMRCRSRHHPRAGHACKSVRFLAQRCRRSGART
jgi:hypothetical protein